MKTLTQIQTFARQHGRAEGLTLTDASGLSVFNGVYRLIGMRMPWPELRVIDTDMSTTNKADANGASTMDWPAKPIYTDLRTLEVQDSEDSDRYKLIVPAENEIRWAEAQRRPATAVPEMYVRYRDITADTNKIEFRPQFTETGKTIRRTGIIAPDELLIGDDQTVFENPLADDALGYLVSAAYFDIDGFGDDANKNLGKAAEILSSLFGRDVQPAELGAVIGR